MPTYAQLQAEQWWNREIVTAELDWLGDELCRRTGRPRTAAGSKGDNRHVYGSHRSQEWILRSQFCTSRTYTAQTGLTDLQARRIAGFDFTPGSAEDMIAQCQRLLAALKAGQLDDVWEFYGNVDGDHIVDGWDNVRDREITSDSSHLWHWHAGFDRRRMTDRELMERVVAIALGDEEDDLSATEVFDTPIPRPWDGNKTQEFKEFTAWRGNDIVQTRVLVRDKVWPEMLAARKRDEALLAAVKGVDTKTILARIDQRAAEDAARDAHLLELVEQGMSGQLDAAEVVRQIGMLLAPAPDGST